MSDGVVSIGISLRNERKKSLAGGIDLAWAIVDRVGAQVPVSHNLGVLWRQDVALWQKALNVDADHRAVASNLGQVLRQQDAKRLDVGAGKQVRAPGAIAGIAVRDRTDNRF
jgi:hypothetical protein